MFSGWSLLRTKEAVVSLSFLIFVVSSIVSVASGASLRDIEQRTLPAYAVTLSTEITLNSSACGYELGIFRDAVDIRKRWALKMLDSSGAPESGFIYGNNPWLGSRFQCLDIANKNPFALKQEFLKNVSRFRKAEDEFPPYKVNYFVAHLRHNSTVQNSFRLTNGNLISLGLCLPASCTTDQLSLILETMFRERTLVFSEMYAADFRLMHVKDFHDDHTWLINWRIIIVLLVVVLTLLLIIVGTAYDVLVYQKYFNVKEMAIDTLQHRNRKNTSDVQEATADNTKNLMGKKIEEPNFFCKILMCFSVYSNTRYIFITNVGPESIRPIDGLRALSMAWIIGIHGHLYMHDTVDNTTRLWRIAAELWAQGLSNSSYGVDTFFFMSGFLMAYFPFKNNFKKKTENQHNNYKAKVGEFINALKHRFLRLTPAYIMIIGIAEIIYSWHSKTSIFHMSFERPHETCAKYWWRNVLYINNFFPRKEMCLSWSWYMSNDMQFFILGEFLIVLSSVYFYTAATILGVIFVSWTALTGYVSYINGYEATLDEQLIWLDELYDPPWARIGPYIVGIVTAYILVKLNNKLTLRRIYIAAFWFLGSACNLLVLYGLWNSRISVFTSAFYIAISRTAWSIGIAWVLIACCTDNAGIVNSILTWRVWVPLSKLSYSAYLINPLLISSFYLQSDVTPHVDPSPVLVTLTGFVFLAYIFGYVYSMAMESPYVRLVRLFFKPRMKQ